MFLKNPLPTHNTEHEHSLDYGNEQCLQNQVNTYTNQHFLQRRRLNYYHKLELFKNVIIKKNGLKTSRFDGRPNRGDDWYIKECKFIIRKTPFYKKHNIEDIVATWLAPILLCRLVFLWRPSYFSVKTGGCRRLSPMATVGNSADCQFIPNNHQLSPTLPIDSLESLTVADLILGI
uniref:Uncharacterized protein n=1 Tax=Romanomermis culicivorax TaxID=13658 RepID=A0A915KHH4_ROMCU